MLLTAKAQLQSFHKNGGCHGPHTLVASVTMCRVCWDGWMGAEKQTHSQIFVPGLLTQQQQQQVLTKPSRNVFSTTLRPLNCYVC